MSCQMSDDFVAPATSITGANTRGRRRHIMTRYGAIHDERDDVHAADAVAMPWPPARISRRLGKGHGIFRLSR